MKPDQLNKIIHESVRLAIMSALVARGRLSFGELKEILELTDGNLSVHATVLEKHGLLKIKKQFVGRKPRTTFSITEQGRSEFKKYVENLKKFLKINA